MRVKKMMVPVYLIRISDFFRACYTKLPHFVVLEETIEDDL